MFTPLRPLPLPSRVRCLSRRSLVALPALTLLAVGLALSWWVGARDAPSAPVGLISGARDAPPAPEGLTSPDPPLVLPQDPPSPDDFARSDRAQLELAVREAFENCLVAALVEQGLGPSRRPLFATVELERALDTDRVTRQAYGELSALRREARWLNGLESDTDLGPRSWEDVRFLLGVVHWYLDGAAKAESGTRSAREAHTLCPEDYDRAALRVYRGLDYGDLLGLWD